MTFRKMVKGSFFATRSVNNFFPIRGRKLFLKLLYGSIIPIIDTGTEVTTKNLKNKKVTFFGKL